MSDALTPKTLEKIDALCESIAQRDQLGEEIQQELRGHIEDKILAYLTGKEALTEDDAFILASEHFGKPAVLRPLLHETHPATRWRPWLRAVSELAMLTLLIQVFVRAGYTLVVLLTSYMTEIHSFVRAARWIDNLHTILAPYVISCALLVALRARWNVARPSGLERMSRERFVILFVAAIALWIVAPDVSYQSRQLLPVPGALERIASGGAFFANIAICAIWVAWMNRRNRTVRALIAVAVVWAIFSWITAARAMWPSAHLLISLNPAFTEWVNIDNGPIEARYKFIVGGTMVFFYAPSGQFKLLLVLLATLQFVLFEALLGFLCYLGIRRLKSMPRADGGHAQYAKN